MALQWIGIKAPRLLARHHCSLVLSTKTRLLGGKTTASPLTNNVARKSSTPSTDILRMPTPKNPAKSNKARLMPVGKPPLCVAVLKCLD